MLYVHLHRNLFVAIITVAKLIRTARNRLSQKEFAQKLGVKQSSVSRYESGKVNPSVNVIEHSMRLVHSENAEFLPTADELAVKVKTGLAKKDQGRLRLALIRLIEVLSNDRVEDRVVTPTSRQNGS